MIIINKNTRVWKHSGYVGSRLHSFCTLDRLASTSETEKKTRRDIHFRVLHRTIQTQ